MKKHTYKITKQDTEGCFFSWIESFKNSKKFKYEIFKLNKKYGTDNIGFKRIN